MTKIIYLQLYSNVISDASIIGLDCETGNIEDCNDGTEDSVPAECSGIFLAPDQTTECGSKCDISTRINYKSKKNSYWLYYKSKVFQNFFCSLKFYGYLFYLMKKLT